MPLKINLGCGNQKAEGVIGVDRNADLKPDVVHDLEITPLPFTPLSVDLVYARQVFEHIHNFVPLMIDIHRILTYGGKLIASVPLFPCRASIADPDHVRLFVPETFAMFTDPFEFTLFRGKGLFAIEDCRIGKHPSTRPEDKDGDFFTEMITTLVKVKWLSKGVSEPKVSQP